MYRLISVVSLALFLFVGCSQQDAAIVEPDSQVATVDDSASSQTANVDVAQSSDSPPGGNSFALTKDNTTIQFVGKHVGEKPDPRTGNFGEFTGNISVVDGLISSIQVEIDTASLSTSIDNLTTHLKSPDFFDVRKHPKATFKSTEIQTKEQGQIVVTGELTLLGVAKPVSFPAMAKVNPTGVSLESTFEIDRTEFGMNYGADKVEKLVAMTITVK